MRSPKLLKSLTSSISEGHGHQREMTEALKSELVQQVCAQHEAEIVTLLAEMKTKHQSLFQSSCDKLLADFTARAHAQAYPYQAEQHSPNSFMQLLKQAEQKAETAVKELKKFTASHRKNAFGALSVMNKNAGMQLLKHSFVVWLQAIQSMKSETKLQETQAKLQASEEHLRKVSKDLPSSSSYNGMQPQQQMYAREGQSGHVESVHKTALKQTVSFHTESETSMRVEDSRDSANSLQVQPSKSMLAEDSAHYESSKGRPSVTQSYYETSIQRCAVVNDDANKFIKKMDKADKWTDIAEAMQSINLSQQLGTMRKRSRKVSEYRRAIRKRCKELDRSDKFQRLVNTVILFNTILVTFTINYSAQNLQDFNAPWARTMDLAFTIFFCIDLLIRLIAHRRKFFTDEKDRWWNRLDFFIVVTAVGEEILNAVASKIGLSTKWMRIIRLLRLMRAFRFFRAARSLSELRALLAGITGSFVTLLWAVCLLTIVSFLFALFFTQTVTNFRVDTVKNPESQNMTDLEIYDNLSRRFGNVARSMATLVQSIAGGVDWGEIEEELFHVSLMCGFTYLLYIGFGIFALMNVVTGVFISKALDESMNEKTNVLICDTKSRKHHIDEVTKIFLRGKVDGDGNLDKDGFIELIGNPCVESYFKFLGLDYEAWDPDAFFELMDFDNSGTVSIDEFVYCCSVLKGSAQRLDLAKMQTLVLKKFDAMMQSTHRILDSERQDREDIAALRVQFEKNAHCQRNAPDEFTSMELLNDSIDRNVPTSLQKKDTSRSKFVEQL